MTVFVMHPLAWIGFAAALVALTSWLLHWSHRRFLLTARGPASTALGVGGTQTSLDRLLAPVEQAQAGQSGIMTLLDSHDAFAARTLSAGKAGRSLDLMYYIWRTDLTGKLLLHDLLAAADRGVRVRLLLDDVNVQGFDLAFLPLAQHPMIEVRLFNPVRNRGHVVRRVVEMALGLSRFNRRMHGKLWIADGRLAIIGGRNVGDTYFGALDRGGNSIDADVMLVGSKVAEVAVVFDSYWNLGLSLPIRTLWPSLKVNMGGYRRRLAKHARAMRSCEFRARALQGWSADTALTERLRWTGKVQLLADPPEKAYGRQSTAWMSVTVASLLAAARNDVRLVTPYFVPGRAGMAGLTAIARRGVKVSLLTNSLSATDLVLVHASYQHYRGPLLAAGVTIHEFSKPAPPGSLRDVLHSKLFLLDGRQAIVGSLNLDLRSAFVNTELGLLFEQPELFAELAQAFDTLSAPDLAYAVTQVGHDLRWAVSRPGLPSMMSVNPEARLARRVLSFVMGHLPIQAYL